MEWFKTITEWKFVRNGVPEVVSLEKWVWGVLYKDGTELHQFDDQGIFHQIGEVKMDDVHLFSVYKPSDPMKRIDLLKTDGMKIFYKYKMTKAFYNRHFSRIIMFGWKKDDKYSNYFILPDDRMIVSDIENVDLPNFKLT